MMNGPLVSVVMAMYNARPYVAEAIESVLRQDHANFELVVVDDGSTDGSNEVVQQYTDSRIHLIRTENRGLSAARNLGIARSQGTYVTFLDSDDLLTSASLSTRLAGFKRQDADCVFSRNLIAVDLNEAFESGVAIARHDSLETARPWAAEFLVEQFVERKFYVFAQAFLIPRFILEAIGGFDESLQVSEDFEFFSRLLPACQTVVETFESCYVYRRTPHSLSAINSRRKADETLRTLRKTHCNLAPYLRDRERCRAQSLFSTCVHVYPYWTNEHRLAMAEARRLRGDEPFDLDGVGGPRAQAVAGLLGWRAGRLCTVASSMIRPRLRRLRGLFDHMADGRASPIVDGAGLRPSESRYRPASKQSKVPEA
jgi:glycosyltransferase involved in cell wall biosynthesis